MSAKVLHILCILICFWIWRNFHLQSWALNFVIRMNCRIKLIKSWQFYLKKNEKKNWKKNSYVLLRFNVLICIINPEIHTSNESSEKLSIYAIDAAMGLKSSIKLKIYRNIAALRKISWNWNISMWGWNIFSIFTMKFIDDITDDQKHFVLNSYRSRLPPRFTYLSEQRLNMPYAIVLVIFSS